jgi:hypothetical protein
MAYCSTTSSSATYATVEGIHPTIWLKLVRSGNVFTGSTAPRFQW